MFLNKVARAAFLFSAFSCLFSQTSPAYSAEQLGEVLVQDSAQDYSAEKPSGFVTTIDPKKFENQLKSLPDLLSQQPGVNVQQFGGLGQYSTVTIRGSSAEQVTVMMDGIKLNTESGGAVDFSSIPLDVIDRIEIIRGGASAQFGSDAIGGVVNIITKKAKKKQSAEFLLGTGTFATIKSSESYSRNDKKFSLVFNHTHLQSSGSFTFLTTPSDIGGISVGGGELLYRKNNAFFNESGLLKLGGKPSEKVRLELITDWFGTHRQIPPTEDTVVLLGPSYTPQANENLLKSYTTLQIAVDSVGKEGLDLVLQPYYRNEYSHFKNPVPALGAPIDTKVYNSTYGGKMAWNYFWQGQSVGQEFKFSYEGKEDLFNNKSPIGNPTTGDHSRLTNGVYFSDEIHLLQEKVLVNPSVRFEHASDFGSRVAMHLGVKGSPLDWITFKSNIDNSFRYPSFLELYLPNEDIFRGNPDLIPEKAINFDVGMRLNHRYGWAELAYFFNHIENSIIFVPISAFTIAPINTDAVHAQGLEFATSLQFGEHVVFDANYTFLDAHIVSNDAQLPGRPRHKVNSRLTLKNKWGSLYANLQYIDRMPIDYDNTTFLGSRAQLDIGCTLNVLKRYYMGVEVKDVNNAQMIDARGFPLPRLSAFGTFGVRI